MGRRGDQMQSEVLGILRLSKVPLSAYDLLGQMRANNPRLAPPTIYRALAALTEHREVHRLESLNAFVACRCSAHRHASILSICDDCGVVKETVAPGVLAELSSIADKSGFAPTRHVIEVHGKCADCGAQESPV